VTSLDAKIDYVNDALISQRVYKAPMPHEPASEILAVDAGRHFYPDVSAAFAVLMPPFCTFQKLFFKE